MSLIEINWTPSRRELKQFACIWIPLFATAAGLLLVYRRAAWGPAAVLWAIALSSLAVGLVRPQAFRPVFVAWMVAAYPIGWTVSTLVLLATYYLLFLPVGLLLRVFRYDPLDRRLDRAAPSYWDAHDQPADPAAYFRQF